MLLLKLIKTKKKYKQTQVLFNYLILLKQVKLIFNKNNNYIKYKNINNIFPYLIYILIILKYREVAINSNLIKYNYNLKSRLYLKNKYGLNNYKKILIKNLIEYIINVNLLNSNIIINIIDLKGTLIISYSSGILNFKGKQKTKNLALTNIIKKIKYKTKYLENKNFAIHLKGTKKNRSKVVNEIKNIFTIKCLVLHNLSPHNGCRPKKIKRKK